jgi:hypothetical protein
MKTGFLASALALILVSRTVFGQATSFTYQGDLRNGGSPASGPHDMRFQVFDAATGGTPLGSSQCFNDVQVVNGKFTTSIDFGQQFSSTAPRYIEIDVRADFGSPCTDVFGYVTLTPRQLIVQAPRAQAANVANALVTPDGSPANAMVVDNDGKVGIGTPTPTHSVHVANSAPTLAIQDTDSSGLAGGQQVGYVSYRDSANAERAWVGYGSAGDPDLTILNARSAGDIVLNTFGGGKVGIGTASPLSMLDVRGSAIRFGSAGQYLAVAGEESLRVIRGTVSETADCNVTPPSAGSGFTLTNLSCGEIRINFTPAFTGTPAVLATGPYGNFNFGDYRFVSCSSVSPGGASIRVFDGDGNNVRSSFHFIAVGPR